MEPTLTDVLNSMRVAVYVCDRTGAYVAVNTAALEMCGATDIEQLRNPADQFRLPAVRFEDGTPIPEDYTPLRRALAGEELVDEIEMLVHETRGPVFVRTITAPVRNASGSIVGAVKVATDITREHELARVKDDFIRAAAHELKTPIAVIKANADAALEALRGSAGPAQRPLEGLSRGVDRIDRLINSLLDLVDLQGSIFSVSRVPTRLDELIEAAIERLPRAAAARVELVASSTAPILVRCDEPRMRRVIYSLLDNALKYSPRDTPIEVSLRHGGDVAVVAIRDHGIGIPADKQLHIFEKYFRAHAGTPYDAGGIGAGLFVAREIVVQHGGRIWFESVEDQGTTFFVELPVAGVAKDGA